MHYRIIGAQRLTGDDVDIVIEAPSQGAAETKAHRLNVLIERIQPVDDRPAVALPPVPQSAVPPARIDWGAAAVLIVVLLVCAMIYAGEAAPDADSAQGQ